VIRSNDDTVDRLGAGLTPPDGARRPLR
jgi:hypothetical protein